MNQFLVSPDELRGHAAQLDSFAGSAQQGFEALRGELADLESSFQGRSAARYAGLMEEWQDSARSLTTALSALGQVLADEASATEDLDATLAGRG